MSDAEMTEEEVERSASVLGQIIDIHADAIGQHMNEQFYGASGLFFRLENKKPRDRRPVYGPDRPVWIYGDVLAVERLIPDALDFELLDYDYGARLDRDEVRELRDMLTRWLGDDQ